MLISIFTKINILSIDCFEKLEYEMKKGRRKFYETILGKFNVN